MKLRCDFHIHSALSPCADPEMTPGNIVGMAKLTGLKAIAITDHQSCGNCASAIAQSDNINGPVVLPGLEVESSEEIHLICLFADLAAAQALAAMVWSNLPVIHNRADIFGEQTYYDHNDLPSGREERLLLNACSLSCDELARLVFESGGVLLPAHIDREAYSMLTVLGRIPADFPARLLEISALADESEIRSNHPELDSYSLIRGSDAHCLADLAKAGWELELPGRTAQLARDKLAAAVIKALRAGLS